MLFWYICAMTRRGLFLSVSLALCALACSCASREASKKAEGLLAAHQAGRSIPRLSAERPALDLKEAYRIQKAYVEKRLAGDRIAGFKAGITSTAAQARFGVPGPVSGVLFDSGRSGPKAERKGARRMMIEAEIGFVVGKKLTRPVRDEAELRAAVRAVLPVVELPDLGFDDPGRLTGPDVAAANVGSFRFIPGKERFPEGVELRSVPVTLTRGKRGLGSGRGSDVMGDPWRAARWVVNRVVEQGYVIEPGHVIITGALGGMHPGRPGKYAADYGDLGRIEFEIR